MIKKDNYERIAECIQGEQMSAPEVAELFEDDKFLKWYKKEYNIRTERDDTPQEKWIEGHKKWKDARCPHN
jgi:hypothetical protein